MTFEDWEKTNARMRGESEWAYCQRVWNGATKAAQTVETPKSKKEVCKELGHAKVEMTEKEAYPAACGWYCSRCDCYKLWEHAWNG